MQELNEKKEFTEEDLDQLAHDLLESLRPHHLRVFEIAKILKKAYKLLDCVVLK